MPNPQNCGPVLRSEAVLNEDEIFLRGIEESMLPEICEVGTACRSLIIGQYYIALVCPRCTETKTVLEMRSNARYPILLACQLCETDLKRSPVVCPTCTETFTGAVRTAGEHPGWIIYSHYYNDEYNEDQDEGEYGH